MEKNPSNKPKVWKDQSLPSSCTTESERELSSDVPRSKIQTKIWSCYYMNVGTEHRKVSMLRICSWSSRLTLCNIQGWQRWRSAVLQLQLKRRFLQPLEFFLFPLALQQPTFPHRLAGMLLFVELARCLEYFHLQRQLGVHQAQLGVLGKAALRKGRGRDSPINFPRCSNTNSSVWIFLLYLCSLRDTLVIQFKRSADTSVNLRRLLPRQQRVVVRQLARQLLNIAANVRHQDRQFRLYLSFIINHCATAH